MTTSSLDTIKAREESLLCRTYGRYPVSIASGKGSRVADLDGKEYVDLLAGIAVTSLGHCNEEIAQVIEKQARKLIHVSNLFYQEEQLELAEELLSLSHFGKVFFCNSGAEANEAQIKLARRYMQRVKNVDAYEIITLDKAFHGRTYATMAATGQERFQDGFAPIPDGFKTVPWGDLNVLEAAITPKTAAVLVEIVQGEGGIRPMHAEYAKGIEALCREKGILFLVDEVQGGLFRTGKPWAFQHFDLKPDAISCAKALANGLPNTVSKVVSLTPLHQIMSPAFLICCTIFLTTTIDAATRVMASMSSKEILSDQEPSVTSKYIWCISLSILVLGVLLVGGLEIIQALVVLAAIPLLGICVIMNISMFKAVREDFPNIWAANLLYIDKEKSGGKA